MKIVIDPSAVVAVIRRERGWFAILETLAKASRIEIAAPSWIELSVVLIRTATREGRPMEEAVAEMKAFRKLLPVSLRVASFTAKQARLGAQAFESFGKGRGKAPAALNFGDCFSYALAQDRKAPLLFVGKDFTRTDVRSAVSLH